MGYALIYLSLIPIFALIFHSLPNHFYHSTVQYEYSLNDDADDILSDLQSEITITFRRVHRRDEVIINNWIVNIDTISLRSLSVKDNEVSFRAQLHLKKKDIDAELYVSPKIRFPLAYNHRVRMGEVVGFTEIFPISIEAFSVSPLITPPTLHEDIARGLFPEQCCSPETINLPLSETLSNDIRSFANGTRGFPSNVRGNFVRMVYLSAVTITTLGYGDIVPITTTSRLLISLESVLGVVVIGLFLNALGYEKANTKNGG